MNAMNNNVVLQNTIEWFLFHRLQKTKKAKEVYVVKVRRILRWKPRWQWFWDTGNILFCFKIILIFTYCICVCACEYTHAMCMWTSENNLESKVSLATMQVPGITLRSPGLVASALIPLAILIAQYSVSSIGCLLHVEIP